MISAMNLIHMAKVVISNEETLAKNKKELLHMLEQIKSRLEELNDNNFIIEDKVIDELNEVNQDIIF